MNNMRKKARTGHGNMVKIDGEALREQFRKRGLAASRLCKDIGVYASYFANAMRRGVMPNMMIMILESCYDIPRDSYVLPEETEEKNETETTAVEVISRSADDFFSEENMKKLYQLMYSAVYAAMKCALNE